MSTPKGHKRKRSGSRIGSKRASTTTVTTRAGKRQKVEQPERRKSSRTYANKSIPFTTRSLTPLLANEIFPFMQLPAELRNRIYEFAAQDAKDTFPQTNSLPKKLRRGRQSHEPSHERTVAFSTLTVCPSGQIPRSRPEAVCNKELPYMNLTQVSSQIRHEFRPLWLSTHVFPSFVIDGYIKAFFPSRIPNSIDPMIRKRMEASLNPAGQLFMGIYFEKDRHAQDIIQLLKFKLRFPDYNIDIGSWHTENTTYAQAVRDLLNNRNPKWVEWLKRNIFTQVRLETRNNVNVVIKEKFALPWMRRVTPKGPVPKSFLEEFGFDSEIVKTSRHHDGPEWNIEVSVSYG